MIHKHRDDVILSKPSLKWDCNSKLVGAGVLAKNAKNPLRYDIFRTL